MIYDPPMVQSVEDWERDLKYFEGKLETNPTAQDNIDYIKAKIEWSKNNPEKLKELFT